MSMNAFRLTGDIVHLVAVMILLHRLLVVRNAQGVSRKTQELYLVVFLTRYLDLWNSFYSPYNHTMKVLCISWTGVAAALLTCPGPIQETYRSEQDGFPHWKHLALPCFILALVHHLIVGSSFRSYDIMEILWKFSILLEAVATLPQILMFRKYREVESLSGGSFIFLMGLYRFLYVLNWIYRAHTEIRYRHHFLVYFCGVVQVVLGFGGFFWPPEHAQSNASAPILPQMQRVLETMKTRESANLFATFLVTIIWTYCCGTMVQWLHQVQIPLTILSLVVATVLLPLPSTLPSEPDRPAAEPLLPRSADPLTVALLASDDQAESNYNEILPPYLEPIDPVISVASEQA